MRFSLIFLPLIVIMSLSFLAFYPAAPACEPTRNHIAAGMQAETEGDHEKAIRRYNCALELDQADAEAYYQRGVAYREMGNYGSAIADFTQAIALSDQPAYYNQRGWTHYLAQNYMAAMFDYDTALTLDPMLAEAYFNRSVLHAIHNDFERAQADYDRALELSLKSIQQTSQFSG
jgi:tetratricopeptide (TPR) repeat protein